MDLWTFVSMDQETEDVLISEILVSQRGEGLAVCFVHVCAGLIRVNLGDNKGTALCLCQPVRLGMCVLHILVSLRYSFSFVVSKLANRCSSTVAQRLKWRKPLGLRSSQICISLTTVLRNSKEVFAYFLFLH